jgi:3-deoxy-D-manno-octulosonic-acid transferase
VLLSVYRRLYALYPDLLLVLAPRHLERVATVVRHVQAYNCRAVRRSWCEDGQTVDLAGATVIVLDIMGELATLYSLCTVAFIGGSLVPIGGHNALEPAMFAKPLLFGPHMHHFPELASLLQQGGGAVQVQGEEELYERLIYLLTHPEAGKTMGRCALAAITANRGALERTCTAIKAILSTSRPA